jgi:microcystin-dependent protein
MSDPYIAEIRMFAGNFAPRGWALCNGQLLPISQNTALFSLLGTNFGGNGTTTFGLPNLQGLTPLGAGQGNGLTQRVLGEIGGETNVTLTQLQMPIHAHAAIGSDAAGGQLPANNVWSKPSQRGINAYNQTQGTPATMNPSALSPAGSGVPHNNLMPYLVVNFIICMQGIFPSRN